MDLSTSRKDLASSQTELLPRLCELGKDVILSSFFFVAVVWVMAHFLIDSVLCRMQKTHVRLC